MIVSLVMVASLMAFSIANAFALEGAQPDGTPLTSAKQLCKELKNNYGQTVKDIKAYGLSKQLSQAEINSMIKDAKAYKKLACDEAKDAAVICKELKAGYKEQAAWVKAKGLSLQISEAEVKDLLNNLKVERKYWCGKATTLTSAVKLCSEAKKSYSKDKAAINAKGISLQLSQEEIDLQLKDLKNYKNKLCKEAKN